MKTPFGNSEAAKTLAKLVENDKNSKRYVSCTLSELGLATFGLYQIKNQKARYILWVSLKKEYLSRINSSVLPDIVKSYLKNVVITKLKKTVQSL